MKYKDHEVTEVRKTSYDCLWHIVYLSIGLTENYDRVKRAEALRVAKRLDKLHGMR